MRRILLLLTLLALCACGRKGALVPPEALAPAPITDLQLAQKGSAIQLTWPPPTRQVEGSRLTDLAGFILLRHEVLPKGEDCDICPNAYSAIARIDLDYPQHVRRVDNLFAYADREVTVGKVYRYKARSFNIEGEESADSNKPQRLVVPPPPPPSLEVIAGGTGASLNITSPAPEEGTLLGYNIYRRKLTEELPLTPLNPAPLAENRYEDQVLERGVRYGYTVTAVAEVRGEVVESSPSTEVLGGLLEVEAP